MDIPNDGQSIYLRSVADFPYPSHAIRQQLVPHGPIPKLFRKRKKAHFSASSSRFSDFGINFSLLYRLHSLQIPLQISYFIHLIFQPLASSCIPVIKSRFNENINDEVSIITNFTKASNYYCISANTAFT
jgi:hypothetical protein